MPTKPSFLLILSLFLCFTLPTLQTKKLPHSRSQPNTHKPTTELSFNPSMLDTHNESSSQFTIPQINLKISKKQSPKQNPLNLDTGLAQKHKISQLSNKSKQNLKNLHMKDFDEDVMQSLTQSELINLKPKVFKSQATVFDQQLSNDEDNSIQENTSFNSDDSASETFSGQNSSLKTPENEILKSQNKFSQDLKKRTKDLKLMNSNVDNSPFKRQAKINNHGNKKNAILQQSDLEINNIPKRERQIQEPARDDKIQIVVARNSLAMSVNSIDKLVKDVKSLQGEDLQDEIAFLLSRTRLNFANFQQSTSDEQVKTVLLMAKFFKERKSSGRKELRSLIGNLQCNLRHEEFENVVDATMTRSRDPQEGKKTKVRK